MNIQWWINCGIWDECQLEFIMYYVGLVLPNSIRNNRVESLILNYKQTKQTKLCLFLYSSLKTTFANIMSNNIPWRGTFNIGRKVTYILSHNRNCTTWLFASEPSKGPAGSHKGWEELMLVLTYATFCFTELSSAPAFSSPVWSSKWLTAGSLQS